MATEPARELIFEVREAPEGGYTARALGESIFTEADDWASLESEIRDAVDCHYDAGERPAVAACLVRSAGPDSRRREAM